MAQGKIKSGEGCRPIEVCIFGHSLVRDVGNFCYSSPEFSNLRLDSDKFRVEFRAKGGLNFQNFAQLLYKFDHIPDLLFIQLGENDIGYVLPDLIVRDLLSFADYALTGIGVKRVVVGQLLRRDPNKFGHQFNVYVGYINDQLKQTCSTKQNIEYWPHHGFWANFDHLKYDGVHINDSHQKKFWRSIRNAVLCNYKRVPVSTI